MSQTARQEKDMVSKYDKIKNDNNVPPLDRLRAHVLSKGVRSLKRLSQVFKRVDVNKDQTIDIDEFRNALHVGGIYVEKDVEREVFDEIDRDKTGKVNFDEFILALRPPMSKHRMDLVHQAFNKFDKDGNGEVNVDDLKGLYSGKKHKKYLSGELTEDEIFEEWLNNFNGPDNFSGVVTMSDFENYYAGVSASIDTDAYFDLMMRKAWKL